MDQNFLTHGSELQRRFGITVLGPGTAWNRYSADYRLITPSVGDIQHLWRQQHEYVPRLKSEAER